MKNFLKKIIYFYWKLNGIKILSYDINCTGEVKRGLIANIQKKSNFNTFIETGTYLGDTLDFFKNSFINLISIELSGEYYTKAVDRFKDIKNIKIINGDSGEKLSEILKTINEPCLFWLDGHYSSGDTARGEKDTPI